LGKRRQSPISAQTPAAVSVSIPRKQRNAAIADACELAGISCSSVVVRAERLASNSSIPARCHQDGL